MGIARETTIELEPRPNTSFNTPVRLPEDWPTDTIDLTVHDLPHASSQIEWWYFHAHLISPEGRRLAVFCSFFRGVMGQDDITKEPKYGHILTWALTDPDQKKYYSSSRLEDILRLFILEKLRKGEVYKDERIQRALQEMLTKGDIPHPDRSFESAVSCSTTKLDCSFGNSSLRKQDDGSYFVHLADDKISCALRFQPQKVPVRHGENGVTKGVHGEDMFYYFIPRNQVSGTIVLDGQKIDVKGDGWYDHEFGRHLQKDYTSLEPNITVAWNWCAIQLADGSEVAVSMMKDIRTNKEGSMAVLISPDGKTMHSSTMSFEPTKWWRSVRTFEDYPVAWDLEIPEFGVKLTLTAPLEDQEFITVVSKPAFWEGELEVVGIINGEAVQGLAYVERNGFAMTYKLDDFFATVSQEVRRSVESVLPINPELKDAIPLFAHEKRPHLLDGVDIDQLNSTLIRPVREITDRGGKAWRSYAALACCEAVRGDSRKFYKWLAVPELIHTGALIIDDLQDKSERRRGGSTVHKLYGENTAITAGTNAYFFAHGIFYSSDVSDADKLKLYDLYFEALREAHVGQALDLVGFNTLADETLISGDASNLERRVLAMYRLKTSAPVACLARMGAIAGGGTDAQIEALGSYFETLGVAFQIVDDVLNLRGFEGNLKDIGEDITAEKITLPITKALGTLDREKRKALLAIVRSKSSDPKKIDEAIKIMEECGALDACIKDAYDLVESAWVRLEPVLEPSIPKIMLRVLGWYVLERHY